MRILEISMVICIFGFAANYEVVKFDNNWAANPLFTLVSESPTGVEVVFSMHEMVIEDTDVNGVMMKTISVPGFFLPNQEGAPNCAGAGRYIAIPQGAQAQLTILGFRTETHNDIDVAPAFKIPMESDDSPLYFEKDMSIYSRNAYYPESPVTLSRPKQIRGVDVVIVGITPFQYNPVTKELIVYKDIRVRIDFIGGNGHFGEDRLRSRFWEPILQEHLLNYKSLPEIDFYAPERFLNRQNDNVEYIIIVPNDATFEAWGNQIKHWRQLQGITSEVYTLNEIGGSDSASIKNFLENAYLTWNPAPVAFLILSDFPVTGDVYGVTAPYVWHASGIRMPSDNWYADYNNDTLPEMHHGRICAQNSSQLAVMISKVLSYEQNPYTNASYYNTPLVCCGWQTSRWFQILSEVIRGFFINGLGRNPARQYGIYAGTPIVGNPWSTATNTSAVVHYWYNVGWLPDTLNQHDAAWWNNGSAAGINNAINAGAFIAQHRDHGDTVAWVMPKYDTTDMNGLSNTELTFVFSINCLTGYYDHPTKQCFAEKFHRIEHGALGVHAPTRNSYSFVNDVYLWGMYDHMWSGFDPGYPMVNMTGDSHLRPCMAMTSGMYYLQASGWPYNANAKSTTYGLYHHHTDCFVMLYSQVPMDLTVSHDATLRRWHTYFAVTADINSVIALTVNGEIIGVAEGTGNPLNISIPNQTPGDTMVVTVTKPNYRRYYARVPIVGALYPFYARNYGVNTYYTAVSAYNDTILCIADYHGNNLWCRYVVSYNGGDNWYWSYVDDTTTTQESADVTLRKDGGSGVVYRFYAPVRELRYTWRDYSGVWGSPNNIADYEPYWNKPSIEYLGDGKYGVTYLSWLSPAVRGAYFDQSDWVYGIHETSLQNTQSTVTLGPNPSQKVATLSFATKKQGNIKVSLYDVTGRLVRIVMNETQPAGHYNITINNQSLSSGLYFVRLETEAGTTIKKMALIR
jgi:hypothetical protein